MSSIMRKQPPMRHPGKISCHWILPSALPDSLEGNKFGILFEFAISLGLPFLSTVQGTGHAVGDNYDEEDLYTP
jgi:hypothetical protein